MKLLLTSEHFERARTKLDAAEEQIKAERVKLAELERDVAKLAASFELVGPDTLEVRSPAKSIKPRKLPQRARQVKAAERNHRYSSEQIETLRTASRGDLPKLAEEWGRTPDGLEKKREAILGPTRRAPVAKPDAETVRQEPLPEKEGDSAERAFYEDRKQPGWRPHPASGIADLVGERGAEWHPPARRLERPGTPVDGIVDNGPDNPRIYDERAFASKERS